MKKYYPILLSKEGELVALQNLSQNIKDGIAPVLEITADTLFKDGDYKNKIQDSLLESWAFEGNKIFVDFSYFTNTSGEIRAINRLLTYLLNNGVNACPVMSFNSDAAYIALVQRLIAAHNCEIGIRLNNAGGGFINYNPQIQTLLTSLNTTRRNTTIILDLGYSENANFNLLATIAYTTITGLNSVNDWVAIVVASGSFLSDLGGLPAPTTATSPAIVYRLPRYEWQIWTYLNTLQLPRTINYGDFGTKNPLYLPAAFEGSASIKYTRPTEFVIYRGRKGSEHRLSAGQYHVSANALIRSRDYSGRTFSWGDEQIYQIGNRDTNPGNAGSWVKISINHHITLLHSLL